MSSETLSLKNSFNPSQLGLNSNITESVSSNVKTCYDLIVFCHLRWDFVYQRPQHIFSRLSSDLKILFVEEPLLEPKKSNTLFEVNPNLHVFQPNISELNELPYLLLKLFQIDNKPIGWFYSPSFCKVLEGISFSTIIYDCMDELSLFKGTPNQFIAQEIELLNKAEVVYTGGKSLFEAKSILHSNVYCFPSSVDIEHFSITGNGIVIPTDLNSIPLPIIGYMGVLDERLDLELIENTASALPECSFVFIGPIVKIKEDELPRLSNIHYLGIKPYKELPFYLKRFDIAMLPFALNDSTKFSSPTKTLEYMAAGKPIISTEITDVVRDYSHCVRFISNADGFVSQIKKLLGKKVRPVNHLYELILKRTSWNNTVDQMKSIITETLAKSAKIE